MHDQKTHRELISLNSPKEEERKKKKMKKKQAKPESNALTK